MELKKLMEHISITIMDKPESEYKIIRYSTVELFSRYFLVQKVGKI